MDYKDFNEFINEFLGIIDKDDQSADSSANITDCMSIVGVCEPEPGVVMVKFADGSEDKAVCDKNDTYELRRGIEVCLLHKFFGGMKNYNEFFNSIVKQYKAGLKAKEEEEKLIKEEERKRAKRAERKKKREMRRAEKSIPNSLRSLAEIAEDPCVKALLLALEKAIMDYCCE